MRTYHYGEPVRVVQARPGPFSGRHGTVVPAPRESTAWIWPVWVFMWDSTGLNVVSNPCQVWGFTQEDLEPWL